MAFGAGQCKDLVCKTFLALSIICMAVPTFSKLKIMK